MVPPGTNAKDALTMTVTWSSPRLSHTIVAAFVPASAVSGTVHPCDIVHRITESAVAVRWIAAASLVTVSYLGLKAAWRSQLSR